MYTGPMQFEQIAVECYDLPVVNGSRGFVIYKADENTSLVTESERPVFMPGPRVEPEGEYNFTVCTCMKVHNKGAYWIPEFIRYQQTIGVDHIHLSALDSFIQDYGFVRLLQHKSVRTAIETGYVSH